MDGQVSSVTIEEKCSSVLDSICRVPDGEATVSFSSGLYQSLSSWLSRNVTSQLLEVQSYDRGLFGNPSNLEGQSVSLEFSMSLPEHIPEAEHACSHSDDLTPSSDLHLSVSMSHVASSRTSSDVSSVSAASEDGANNSTQAATFSMVPSTSTSLHKDTESSEESNSDKSDVSSYDRSDSSSLDAWLPPPSAEDDDSSSEEFNSDDDNDDGSASSYASSCTETTLTPSTISAEGAQSLEIRWCQVEYAVIHPLMATLCSTLAAPKMECVPFRSLRYLVLNAVDGRIAVRLQSTLALHQKSYLMDFVLQPRLVVLGQGIDWCSDDDLEDWLDVSERFPFSHHNEFSYED